MNHNNNSLSIIIPVKNTEKHIVFCLNSLFNNTYSIPVELIIINDHSTDKSLQLTRTFISSISKNDNPFREIIIKDLTIGFGAASARNLGIKLATSNLITFIDADDQVSENGLDELVKALIEQNADISIGNMYSYAYDGDLFSLDADKYLVFKREADDFVVDFPYNQNILCDMFYKYQIGNSVVNKIFKKDIIGWFSITDYYEDFPFSLNAMMQAKRIVHIDSETYRYRTNQSNSLTGKRYSCEEVGWEANVVEHQMIIKAIEQLSGHNITPANQLKADNVFIRKSTQALNNGVPEYLVKQNRRYLAAIKRMESVFG